MQLTEQQRDELERLGGKCLCDGSAAPVTQFKFGPVMLTVPNAGGEPSVSFLPDDWQEAGDDVPLRKIAEIATILGITPTETLEAGEVVPLALVDSIIREVLTNEEKYVPAAMLGNQGLNAYHGIMREIGNALSRLQQNGGETR